MMPVRLSRTPAADEVRVIVARTPSRKPVWIGDPKPPAAGGKVLRALAGARSGEGRVGDGV